MKNRQRGLVPLIILLVVVIGVIGVEAFGSYRHYLNSKQTSTISSQSGSQTKLETNTSQSTAIKQQVQVQTVFKKIGDKFTLWDIEYQILSISDFISPYDMLFKTSGKYLGIKIEVTNIGKTELGVNNIYVQDNKGRQYQRASLGYQQLGVEDYGQEKVQPGIPGTYGVIFEVAKDSTGLQLVYPSSTGQIVAQVALGM